MRACGRYRPSLAVPERGIVPKFGLVRDEILPFTYTYFYHFDPCMLLQGVILPLHDILVHLLLQHILSILQFLILSNTADS